MDKKLNQALEKVERATAKTTSKQPRFSQTIDRGRFFMSVYDWYKNSLSDEPVYSANSSARDRWLSTVWQKEAHFAGVINSVVSIDKNRQWYVTGGRNQASRFNSILRSVDGGKGWRNYMSRTALSFYTADIGAITEIGRDGKDGPVRELFFVDPARCRLSGDAIAYTAPGGKEQQWQAQDFFSVNSLASTNEDYNGLGFCAESRALQFIRLMLGIYEHDMEMLGAKAPRGLLLLQNIDEQQWEDAMAARKVKQTQREQEWFGSVAVLAQNGIENIDAKLVALSQLPANFDLQTYTNLLMYGYALCVGYDPREFWPVSSGSLGTATESEVQHNKATGKGGLDFILNYQDRLQQTMPDTVLFEFEQRDISGELETATVQKAWVDVAAVLYDKGMGVLTKDQTLIYLADQGIIPADWTATEEDATIESSGQQRMIKRSAEHSQTWAAAFAQPLEPLVSIDSRGKTKVIARSGLHFLKACAQHPLARSMATEHGYRAPTIARDIWGHSFNQPAQLTQRAALYDEDDVTITMEDVTRALDNGKKRAGKEFGQLVMAKTENE